MNCEITYQPLSGEFEEYYFDYDSNFKGKDWTWAKFETSDYYNWYGSFRGNPENSDCRFSEKLGLAFILTGDAGYIIDIDTKKHVKIIKNEMIQSIELTADEDYFIFADFDTIYRLDKNLEVIQIPTIYHMDFIKFNGFDKEELLIKFEEPGEWQQKTCRLNIKNWIIK